MKYVLHFFALCSFLVCDISSLSAQTCSGAPVAGVAGVSSSVICSGDSVTLGLTGYSSDSGISLQWQYSSDSSSWTDISGAPDAAYSYAPDAAYYFRCAVTCSHGGTAMIHTVAVGPSGSLTFSPSSFSMNLGDTVQWVLGSGYHTTTSTTIPSGAAPWDYAFVPSTDTVFSYVPADTGTYNYNCTYHSGLGMAGSFRVGPSAGATSYSSAVRVVSGLTTAGAITGTTTLCQGATTSLADTPAGGSWSVTDTSVATIDTAGVLSGVSGGTTTVVYKVTSSCGVDSSTTVVTVNPLPSVGTITSRSPLCPGNSEGLTDSPSGGIWASSDSTVASVTSSGSLTAISAGTASITYTVTNSCGSDSASTLITVLSVPVAGPVTGVAPVCMGASISLSDSASGGVWLSGDSTIAMVSSAGTVTGVAAGTAAISYVVSNTCGSDTASVPVNVLAAPLAGFIGGATSVCNGSTITLTDIGGDTTGTWVSDAPAIANVSSTGVVTGAATGTVTITYTVSNSCGTDSATYEDTVITFPSAGSISDIATCVGGLTLLSDSTATSGGTWSSLDTAVARIASGYYLQGVSADTTTIFYTVINSCGSASATALATIISTVSAGVISGADSLCVGNTTTLSDTASGGAGTWSSSDSSVATVAAGVVTAVSAGTATIRYVVTSTCGTTSATFLVKVNGVSAGIIRGASVLCSGSTDTLSDALTGGTWSSSDTSVAKVTSAGVVTASGTGSVTISYVVSGVCGADTARKTIIVGTVTSAGVITGADSICLGDSTVLSDSISGGKWHSLNTAIVTVDSLTGTVTAVGPGTTFITYKITTSCGSPTAPAHRITVRTLPSAGTIAGSSMVCTGASITLGDGTTGGTWRLSNGNASYTSSGGLATITGVSTGMDTVRYITGNFCGMDTATKIIAINSLHGLSALSGGDTVCTGATITLSDTASGGRWYSSSSAATVSSSGVVTGAAPGSVTIGYIDSSVCGSDTASKVLTVLSTTPVGTILGSSVPLCVGDSTTLTDAATGGVWTASNSHASVTNGVVVAISGGVDSIIYTVYNYCGSTSASKAITVIPAPVAGTISGIDSVCQGAVVVLTDTFSGGGWITSNGNAISRGAGSSRDTLEGITAGIDTITYMVTNACGTDSTLFVLKVNSAVAVTPISGYANLCIGDSTTLSDATGGGVWSASDTDASVVNGTVTAVAAGVDTIYYTVTNSCGTATASHAITVSAYPDAGTIAGVSSVCVGSTAILFETATGGTWTSSNPALATVSTSGEVRGVAAGTVSIGYSVFNSCGTDTASHIMTISPDPVAGTILGASAVCMGSVASLTDSATGGIWMSSDTLLATVNDSGVVTGISAGVDTLFYAVTNSCATVVVAHPVQIDSPLTTLAIGGGDSVCVGGSVTLIPNTAGGVWSSSNTVLATVNSSGVVSGVNTGTVAISYVLTNSCNSVSTAQNITVQFGGSAGMITGFPDVCVGNSLTLSDTTMGGIWSTGDSTLATVSSAGVITGVSAGVDTIRYTISNACGMSSAAKAITVNAAADAGTITGADSICLGASATLSDSIAHGLWISSDPMTVVVSAGVVTGVASGTATIWYRVSNSCGVDTAMQMISVIAPPNAGVISGKIAVCHGGTIALTDSTIGGTWVSSNSLAIVEPTGLVIGVHEGTAAIEYIVSNFCGSDTAFHNIRIDSTVSAGVITGNSIVCIGTTITLGDTASGGNWLTSDSALAKVNGSGVVSGIAAGIDTIKYQIINSCATYTAAKVLSVVSPVSATPITGDSALCMGAVVTLSDTASGGTWRSGNTAIATVSSTGVVTGIATGIDSIYYNEPTVCGNVETAKAIRVNATPTAGAITSTGSTTLCVGAMVTLSDTTAGGSWLAMGSGATVTSSGLVTVAGTGSATIEYVTPPNTFGCTDTAKYNLTVVSGSSLGVTSTIANETCNGLSDGSISITVSGGSGAYTYSWGNGATSSSITGLAVGTYSVKIKDDSTQCTYNDSFMVDQPNALTVADSLTADQCNIGTGTATLYVSGGTGTSYTYAWTPGGYTGASADSLKSQMYTVVITDKNGCTVTDTFTIQEGDCNKVTVFNAITPNGDGVNDTWVIEGINDFPNCKVQLFDKWGALVYDKTGYSNTFDGKGNNGKLLPAGTYYYVIKLNEPLSGATPSKDFVSGYILLKY
jgi:trimeric autotransporter adhesin